MRKTTTVIVQIVEEDSFPTVHPTAIIDTTAVELEGWSRVRCPTDMLPPALQRLAAWNRRALP